jgi:cytochrome c oxidase subunit 3
MSVVEHAVKTTSREPVIPNPVIAVGIFIFTEVMLFSGFISAHTIAASSVDVWPPLDQPRLPIEATAVNTLILLVSGALLFWAGRRFKSDPVKARTPMVVGLVLGGLFVLVQGYEWVSLVSAGLTLQSSTHGGFFYLIVGTHGLHVMAGLVAMVMVYVSLIKGTLTPGGFWASRLYWYFVVLLWPVLYITVYL